jgi:hypothetical protein
MQMMHTAHLLGLPCSDWYPVQCLNGQAVVGELRRQYKLMACVGGQGILGREIQYARQTHVVLDRLTNRKDHVTRRVELSEVEEAAIVHNIVILATAEMQKRVQRARDFITCLQQEL